MARRGLETGIEAQGFESGARSLQVHEAKDFLFGLGINAGKALREGGERESQKKYGEKFHNGI